MNVGTVIHWLPVVVMVACWGGLLVCVLGMWQNNRTFNYRMWLAEQVSIASRRAIARGENDWERYYIWLRAQPDYDAMMYRFWRSFDSFIDWNHPDAPPKPNP